MWDDKRYYSLSYYLKERFGQKVYKLSLNGGMTCPNRDGTLGSKGCIFCSEGGSGDFTTSPTLSITEQIAEAKLRIKSKNIGNKYIAYFQAFTNTYADISYLRKIYYEAISHPDIIALSIATRPDCLDDDVLKLLDELNQIKPVFIELGLQTANDNTAVFIRRGYSLSCFIEAVHKLNTINIEIIVHVILGLPYETREDILHTISVISHLPIKGVKLQLLHILKNTDLSLYIDDFHILTMEEYIDLVTSCIELLPDHIVIHRITGDGPKNILIAPLWSGNKKNVLNQINHALLMKDTWQGKYDCRIK
jgi:radical SAM protein (TIGR01212 family)